MKRSVFASVAVAVLLCGCGASHGSSERVTVGCSTAQAPAHTFTGARTSMLAVRGSPFGVASNRRRRCRSSMRQLAPWPSSRMRAIRRGSCGRSPCPARRSATRSRTAVASCWSPSRTDAQEASVLSVAAATSGGQRGTGVLRSPHPLGGGGPIEVSGTPDGAYAFVSVEYGDRVDVFNLRAALRGGFKRSTYVGRFPRDAGRRSGAVTGMGAGCT